MKAGFLDKLIERLGRIGPEEVQNYLLRLAQEKGLIETVFNAIQEGIIVTDAKGNITYINDAACKLFGLEAERSIARRASGSRAERAASARVRASAWLWTERSGRRMRFSQVRSLTSTSWSSSTPRAWQAPCPRS